MQAAILYDPGQPLAIEDIALPTPLHGQVRVRIAFAGICRSQLMEARGLRGKDPYLPHLLGHEATGTVVEIGEGVTKVQPGDKVVLTWIKGDGLNAPGPVIHHGGQRLNAGSVTTWSEETIASENRCVKLPDGVPLDVGALFGCALLTGAGMIINTIAPPPGSTIAIVGLGGIGLSALMATRLYDCSKVIACDIDTRKLELASELGATDLIDGSTEDVIERCNTLVPGGVDFAVDATGAARGIELAFASVRRGGGLCVFATHPAHGEHIRLDPFELICGKRIVGSWGGEAQPDRDIPRFATHYLAGNLPLDRLMDARYPLTRVNEALADLEHGRIARGILAMAVR